MTYDPYELDLTPTGKQVAVLRRLVEGDRILIIRGGHGFEWERSGRQVYAGMVRQLVARHWVSRPDYPLFGDGAAGRITNHGRAAFARF
jgi:hypothetical protein